MNNKFKYIAMSIFAFVVLTLTSCNNDDDTVNESITGNGNIQLKFENGFSGLGPISLNSTVQTTSSNQKINYSTLKYIVSNIVLIKEDGTEVKYNYNNPDLGAFIIDQNDAVANEVKINLTDLPAANYSKIRFGLGISEEAFLLGQTGQADFWSAAQAKGMTWSWAAGYISVKLEGQFGATTPDTQYRHHLGKKMSITANPTIYREVTLNLPVSAKIRTNVTPSIHFLVDWNKHLSGQTSILLDDASKVNMSGTGIAVSIMDNLTQAFTVEHVHND